MSSENQEGPEFQEELLSRGFDEKTVKRLKDNGFEAMSDLALLAEEEDSLKDLKLSLAQRLLLKREVRKMTDGGSSHQAAGTHNADAGDVAVSRSSTTCTTLSQVMDELTGSCSGATAVAGAVTAGLGNSMLPGNRAEQPSDVVWSTDPLVFLRGGCNDNAGAKTVYEIVDFINLVPPVLEEQVMSEQGQVQLVYRSAPRKPKLESVSVEEWCLANTRIMEMLLTSRDWEVSVLKDYICHTMKVCEFFKHYQRPSVLQYDREYRHLQARHGFRWGTDCPHLHTLHLRLKQQPSSTATAARSHAARHNNPRSNGSQLCFQFNSRQGCSYGDSCRFRHQCSEPGCVSSHPRTDHRADGQPVSGSRA